MAHQKGPPPAPLHPHVVNKLLDLLSTDDDFRDLFQRDAHAALVHAGYQAPEGASLQSAAATSGGACMQLSAGDQLASKERIAQDRAKLQKSMSMIQGFEPLAGLKAS